MIVIHNRIIACTSAVACSDTFLTKLGHGPTLTLKATLPTDIVHGSITIAHNQPPLAHEITVEIYDAVELPNAAHQSTLAKPAVIPTEAAIKANLDK